MKKVLVRSILAGIMIAIGAITYMNAPAPLGAFMFSIGLLSIFLLNLQLFTGLVPYTTKVKEVPFILTVLLGNMIGSCLMFAFPSDTAVDVVNTKLQDPYWLMFVSAMLCNVLIFIAVEANKKNNIITVIIAVASFIICGFNHSIANVCFVISARKFSWDVLVFILISVVGNAVGGICFRKLIEYANSKNREKLHS